MDKPPEWSRHILNDSGKVTEGFSWGEDVFRYLGTSTGQGRAQVNSEPRQSGLLFTILENIRLPFYSRERRAIS